MNERLFIISQISINLACFVISFYVTWPITNHLMDFSGYCALFSCGTFNEENGHFEPKWASNSFCVYAIAVGVYTVIYSFVQAIIKIRIFYYNIERTFKSSAVDFLLDCFFVLIVLICSILVSSGLYTWCGCVTQRFNTCDIASSVMEISYHNTTIVAKNFSVQLESAQNDFNEQSDAFQTIFCTAASLTFGIALSSACFMVSLKRKGFTGMSFVEPMVKPIIYTSIGCIAVGIGAGQACIHHKRELQKQQPQQNHE